MEVFLNLIGFGDQALKAPSNYLVNAAWHEFTTLFEFCLLNIAKQMPCASVTSYTDTEIHQKTLAYNRADHVTQYFHGFQKGHWSFWT